MNKDRIVGTAKQLAGTVKEKIGGAVGNTRMVVDGKIEQAVGKVRGAVGVLKEKFAEKK